MNLLVTYDIATTSPEGRRRLRHVARICQDYGQRVQYSVFECLVDERVFATFRTRLLDVMNPQEDSLRIYTIPGNLKQAVETYGHDRAVDFEGPLIV